MLTETTIRKMKPEEEKVQQRTSCRNETLFGNPGRDTNNEAADTVHNKYLNCRLVLEQKISRKLT